MKISLDPRLTREQIGEFRIEALLGVGGMSEVYRAFDEAQNRRVALKRLRPEAALNSQARRRFRREARAMIRIRHRSVAPVYDVIQSSQGDWIVMELIEGSTLAEALKKYGSFTPRRGRRIALQIAEGLEAAHVRGVVHRDVKTENVFLTVDERGVEQARIFDFGLAKDLWESGAGGGSGSGGTNPGAMVGTCRGMAPEQALSKAIDHRADLFSFGVLIYEMLTGEYPFEASTPLATAEKIVNDDPTPVRDLQPDVSPEFARLIEKMLNKLPENRPSSASHVAASLAALEIDDDDPPSGLRMMVDSFRRRFG